MEANEVAGQSIPWSDRSAWVDTSRYIETDQEALALVLEP